MAHVTRRNGRWQAAWRDLDNREKTKTFDRRADAERFLHAIEADKLRGTYVGPDAGKVTLGTFARGWAERQPWKPQAALSRKANIENHILPYLGDIPLGRLRPSHIQAWRKGRQAALSNGTVRLVVQTLRAILNAAVADMIIPASPASRDDFGHRRDEVVIPDPDEVVALAEALPERYLAALWLAVGSGLRQGELFGLSIDRIDFLRGTLRVDRQLVTLPNAGPAWAPTKNTVVRIVPLAEPTIDLLAAHVSAFPAEDPSRRRRAGVTSEQVLAGLVFTTEDGLPVTRSNAGHVWRRAAARAGFRPGARTGWHLLRHYYASALIRRGLSAPAVAKRLGDTPKTVLQTYAHIFHDDDARTRQAVAAALAEDFGGLARNPGDDSRGHLADMEG